MVPYPPRWNMAVGEPPRLTIKINLGKSFWIVFRNAPPGLSEFISCQSVSNGEHICLRETRSYWRSLPQRQADEKFDVAAPQYVSIVCRDAVGEDSESRLNRELEVPGRLSPHPHLALAFEQCLQIVQRHPR